MPLPLPPFDLPPPGLGRHALPERERGRRWREAKGYSRAQLADLIGYSERMVRSVESGAEPLMQRYRLACAAVDAGLKFDWEVGAATR